MSHVVVERSGIVESIHRVHVAVVDQKGNLLAHVGDPEYLTFYRSAAKPFQAVPLVDDGVIERFELSSEELALCLDNDEAGQKGKERLMTCMSQNFVVSYTKLPKGVKDIQDVKNKKELEAIITKRDIW